MQTQHAAAFLRWMEAGRARLGWSITHLARRSGVTRCHLSQLRNANVGAIKTDTIDVVAAAIREGHRRRGLDVPGCWCTRE